MQMHQEGILAARHHWLSADSLIGQNVQELGKCFKCASSDFQKLVG
jgi:hypothetical protein